MLRQSFMLLPFTPKISAYVRACMKPTGFGSLARFSQQVSKGTMFVGMPCTAHASILTNFHSRLGRVVETYGVSQVCHLPATKIPQPFETYT